MAQNLAADVGWTLFLAILTVLLLCLDGAGFPLERGLTTARAFSLYAAIVLVGLLLGLSLTLMRRSPMSHSESGDDAPVQPAGAVSTVIIWYAAVLPSGFLCSRVSGVPSTGFAAVSLLLLACAGIPLLASQLSGAGRRCVWMLATLVMVLPPVLGWLASNAPADGPAARSGSIAQVSPICLVDSLIRPASPAIAVLFVVWLVVGVIAWLAALRLEGAGRGALSGATNRLLVLLALPAGFAMAGPGAAAHAADEIAADAGVEIRPRLDGWAAPRSFALFDLVVDAGATGVDAWLLADGDGVASTRLRIEAGPGQILGRTVMIATRDEPRRIRFRLVDVSEADTAAAGEFGSDAGGVGVGGAGVERAGRGRLVAEHDLRKPRRGETLVAIAVGDSAWDGRVREILAEAFPLEGSHAVVRLGGGDPAGGQGSVAASILLETVDLILVDDPGTAAPGAAFPRSAAHPGRDVLDAACRLGTPFLVLAGDPSATAATSMSRVRHGLGRGVRVVRGNDGDGTVSLTDIGDRLRALVDDPGRGLGRILLGREPAFGLSGADGFVGRPVRSMVGLVLLLATVAISVRIVTRRRSHCWRCGAALATSAVAIGVLLVVDPVPKPVTWYTGALAMPCSADGDALRRERWRAFAVTATDVTFATSADGASSCLAPNEGGLPLQRIDARAARIGVELEALQSAAFAHRSAESAALFEPGELPAVRLRRGLREALYFREGRWRRLGDLAAGSDLAATVGYLVEADSEHFTLDQAMPEARSLGPWTGDLLTRLARFEPLMADRELIVAWAPSSGDRPGEALRTLAQPTFWLLGW